ncbi:hypothetical protein GF373_15320 [bacterium]|nr:hypothetical protein [bacterium]
MVMRYTIIHSLLFCVIGVMCTTAQDVRRLPVEEYKDKMKAGWIGQMAGVGWGGPTEFKWNGVIIPQDKMPEWKPERINQFHQDDIYVEMTFLRTLEQYGFDVSLRQAGIDFANSGYPLWHANRYGRANLRRGIAPPDSSHPQFNSHADDIDYQIEADYSGLIAPGMPNVAIELGETFGRLMNYGDGLYGGQFVGGMYAEAFFEKDMMKVVEAGLACIPAQSQYTEAIRDTIKWYKQYPDDWKKTWGLINEKYHLNPAYRRFSCSGPTSDFNIDAKINGAYIVMGLLYGEGDIDKTIIISTRCGQDSDCNPSNAAGVLCTSIGYANLPDKYVSALNEDEYFTHTAYNFAKLIDVSETLVRQAVKRAGGDIETTSENKEVFVIPVKKPNPSPFVQCWEPGPIAESRFTEREMEKITVGQNPEINKALKTFAPGWNCTNCGDDMNPGFKEEILGQSDVLLTHPLDRNTACVLSKEMDIPKNKKTTLHLTVGHHPKGDWRLLVKVDGDTILKKTIGGEQAWHDLNIDLSNYAGESINLELHNQPTGWTYEAAYWKAIQVQ